MGVFFEYNNPPSIGKYSIDAVLEKYIGRRKELILIESELEKIIRKVQNGNFSVLKGSYKKPITVEELNECGENKEIERLFKKLFQLKNFDLIWCYSPIPNAMTPCKSLQILDRNYGVTKDGVDYNKKLSILVNINTGMITHLELTAAEIVAVILHEIGHNFYQSMFQILDRINPYSAVSNLLTFIMTDVIQLGRLTIKGNMFIDKIIDMLNLRPVTVIVQEALIVLSLFTPKTLAMFLKVLEGKAILRGDKILQSLIDPSTIFNYNVEKHADSFAVDYGYGRDLASGLNKIDQRVDNFVFNIPGYNWIMDFENLLYDITFQTFSGYPTVHNRQTSALKRLKEAKNDPNLPPHLRKELDEQIKDFEKYYDNYMSASNKENCRRIFTWLYRSMVNKVFKGNVDLREIIYRIDSTHPKNDKW